MMKEAPPPWSFEHLKWLKDTGERLNTADGKIVEVWEFQHQAEEEMLSVWAKHFRNHYCLDTQIDELRGKRTRSEYLNSIKFPSPVTKLGPGIRAGDFAEILVADFMQCVLNHWVPRFRWDSKVIQDESTKGCDVIGFKIFCEGKPSIKDKLSIFEAKAGFSSSSKKGRLQDAITSSAKDHLRIDESLNYIKQRLLEQKKKKKANSIERFQTPVDLEYQEVYGAVAFISDEFYVTTDVEESDTTKILPTQKAKQHIAHPNRDKLSLIIIKGPAMMTLVHELYRRAADEA